LLKADIGTLNSRLHELHTAITGVVESHFVTRRARFVGFRFSPMTLDARTASMSVLQSGLAAMVAKGDHAHP
jgi:hypothetical protein